MRLLPTSIMAGLGGRAQQRFKTSQDPETHQLRPYRFTLTQLLTLTLQSMVENVESSHAPSKNVGLNQFHVRFLRNIRWNRAPHPRDGRDSSTESRSPSSCAPSRQSAHWRPGHPWLGHPPGSTDAPSCANTSSSSLRLVRCM